jgi:hypothetical protein
MRYIMNFNEKYFRWAFDKLIFVEERRWKVKFSIIGQNPTIKLSSSILG